MTFNLVLLDFFGKVNVWIPVYADNMAPNIVGLINTFHKTIKLRAKETLDFSA